MTTTYAQDCEFGKEVGGFILEEAIKYIGDNMSPGDIFDNDILHDWAEENGYELVKNK